MTTMRRRELFQALGGAAVGTFLGSLTQKSLAESLRPSMLRAVMEVFTMTKCSRSLLFVLLVFLVNPAVTQGAGVRLIYDTDMASDVDDVGALALLHGLADRGEVEILATMVSAKNPHTPLCLDAINTFYGRPDIPIGILRGNGVEAESRYAEAVSREYPHSVRSIDELPNAADLYRRILSKVPDKGVVIVTVGFTSNLRDLLNSTPDDFSQLKGVDLVQQKVKTWVCMGGNFPDGYEYNIKEDSLASVRAVHDWPTPIVFSGFEIGKKVMTGARLAQVPENNPVRTAYFHYNGLKNRESWDHTAVLYAVRGLRDYWELSKSGFNLIHWDGFNEWIRTEDKNHAYLVEKMKPSDLAAEIEELMIAPPENR